MAIELNKDAVDRAAKSKEKDYIITDGGGMVLLTTHLRRDTEKGLTVRPEPVEGERLSRSWFDKLTTNGLTLICPTLSG